MINLKQIKRENNLNLKKDYQSNVLRRSRKNKASLAVTSIAIGGGVFLGLLVPGLLPIVTAGMPIMAMSTNIALSTIAGSIVGGTHYAINRKEGKMRKYSKEVAKGFRLKADSFLNEKNSATLEKKSERLIAKSDKFYDRYTQKIQILKQLKQELAQSEVSGRAIEKTEFKIKKLEMELAELNRAYDNAEQMYLSDMERMKNKELYATQTVEMTTSQFSNGLLGNRIHGIKHRLSIMAPNILKVENNLATNKIKSMLNLHTPTIEDNAKFYEVNYVFTKFTPSRDVKASDELVELKENEENLTEEQQQKLDKAKQVNATLDEYDVEFYNFEKYVNNNEYNLPIKDGKSIISMQFTNPDMNVSYTLNDFHKSLSKPLYLMSALVDMFSKGACDSCKIDMISVDSKGNRVDNVMNINTSVDNLKDSVALRNTVYTLMLNYIYDAELTAFNQEIKSDISTIDLIEQICQGAIPNAKKSKANIAKDLDSVLKINNIEKNDIFWNEQVEPIGNISTLENGNKDVDATPSY